MKKKILFIDRDGTIILEPEDEQIDSLEKLEYFPMVFQGLSRICQELDYEIVMITNQDGLGTDSFPENTFWPAHNKMLGALEKEGIQFDEIIIDRTRPEDNAPTRKPGTALLTHYIKGDYDLTQSFVIGDRTSDIQLAKNLGAQGIYIAENDINLRDELKSVNALTTMSWMEIYHFLKSIPRSAQVYRKTNETDIRIELRLDGPPGGTVDTGIKFFDHMLEQINRHGGFHLDIKVDGDLEIDEHHTIEDTALALGEVFLKSLGNKRGIQRYAFVLPMDDSEAHVSLDFGGRPWLVWDVSFSREMIGEMPTEMFYHFFKSFSDTAKCNLNIRCTGENEHHKIEAIFKSFAKCLKSAAQIEAGNTDIPSSKGVL